jgi:hypothetical protein
VGLYEIGGVSQKSSVSKLTAVEEVKVDIIQCNISSFKGEAVQGERDVISSSRALARNDQVYTDFELMVRQVQKRFKKHAKKFRKQRATIA